MVVSYNYLGLKNFSSNALFSLPLMIVSLWYWAVQLCLYLWWVWVYPGITVTLIRRSRGAQLRVMTPWKMFLLQKSIQALTDKWSHCFLYGQRALCTVMRVCYKPLTTQRIHLSIGWWHETSCNSDFITLATEKNRPSTVKELECDFNCRCSMFPLSRAR